MRRPPVAGRLRGALVAGATAIAAAGCGASALTTPVLRDRAADACAAAVKLETRLGAPSRPGDTRAFLQHGLVILTREYVQLHGLDAGGKAAPIFRSAVAALQAEIARLQQAETELAHGDDPLGTIKSLQNTLAPLEQRSDAAWNQLQIPACLTA